MTGSASGSPSVAEIVDAHLATAGITVSPDEREMYIADYPILRASNAKLYEYGDELESSLLFDPASCYGEELA
jgi:hypothetical protein